MIKKHLASYKHALRGIWFAFRYEPNMIVHGIAMMAVLIANAMLKVSRTDWIITLALIGIVLMSEIFNTALETLANKVSQEQDPLIGRAKDLAAGAVLIVGIAAVLCAVIIYWPYVQEIL